MSFTDEEILRRLRDAEKTTERGSALTKSNLYQVEGRTDAALARAFARQCGQNLFWCHPTKTWYWWNDRYWEEDQSCRVEAFAKQFAQGLWRDAAKIIANTETAEQLKKAVIAFVKSANSAAGIRNFIGLAKSEPNIAILPDQLDRNAYLLNVGNGSINLRTGNLQPHSRQDLLTRAISIDYDANATCPQFTNFLRSIFDGNDNLIGFIQKLLGYGLSGDVSEQILAIFWGEGSNGKSTLLTLLLDLLENYAAKAPEKLLTARRFDAHPTELAVLFGKRLVVLNETDDNQELSEARVKDLTGGDKLTARRMQEDFWSFSPSHKFVMATNYRPTIKGGHSIWRRLRLVPFNQRYWSRSKGETGPTELEADPQLAEKLKSELSGILRWLVEGCLAWQREGLGTPPEITEATESYRKSEDSLTSFIEACCVVKADATANVSAVIDAYRDFSGDNISSSTLTKLLTGRGFIKQKSTAKETKNTWQWRGFALA